MVVGEDARQEPEKYKKYKEMKEKLIDIYHEMHVTSSKLQQEEVEAQKQ
jgi:hypothetical protein